MTRDYQLYARVVLCNGAFGLPFIHLILASDIHDEPSPIFASKKLITVNHAGQVFTRSFSLQTQHPNNLTPRQSHNTRIPTYASLTS